jgi:hypothetical protein
VKKPALLVEKPTTSKQPARGAGTETHASKELAVEEVVGAGYPLSSILKQKSERLQL